jgi:hypothetical protein
MRAKRSNFNQKMKHILIQALNQPETAPTLGALWVSHSQFAVNSKTLANQFHITSNTLCSNFRSHGFTTESATAFRNEIADLGAPKECRLHSYEGLNQVTIETALDDAHWRKLNSKKNTATPLNLQATQQIETPPELDEMDPAAATGTEAFGPGEEGSSGFFDWGQSWRDRDSEDGDDPWFFRD